MAIASAVAGPLLAVDDLAYLTLGRTLGGGGAAPLGAQPPYGIGYPVLLAPGWALGLDESQMIVWARAVNSVLGALLVPVLYLLVRRLTGASFGWALTASLVGASLPAAFLTGGIVWTERLLPLLVAIAALALLRLHRVPNWRRACMVATIAVALVAAHPRMMPVAAIVVLAGAVTLWRNGERMRAGAVVAAAAVGIALAEWAREVLARATFDEGATYDGFDLASRRGLSEISDMAVLGTGTLAYLVLATAGLAVLGVAVVVQRGELRVWYPAMTLAVAAVAGWFLTGVDRADAFLHGRYIEVMAPLLVALGVIGAATFPTKLAMRTVFGASIVAGLFGAWAGPGNNWARPRSPVMMLGTEVGGAPWGGNFFEPGAAATVAVVVGMAFVGAAAYRHWAAGAVAVVAVGLGVWSGTIALDDLQNHSAVGQTQETLDAVAIERIAIDTEQIPPGLAAAIAWEVGLDRTALDIDAETTHVVLPVGVVPPDGALFAAGQTQPDMPGGQDNDPEEPHSADSPPEPELTGFTFWRLASP